MTSDARSPRARQDLDDAVEYHRAVDAELALSFDAHDTRYRQNTIHCFKLSAQHLPGEKDQCIEALILRSRPQPKVHRQVREECFDFGATTSEGWRFPCQRSNRLCRVT